MADNQPSGHTRIPDQQAMWNRKHGADEHKSFRDDPDALAREAEKLFPRGAKILELGCGVGRDSRFFAHQGHQVLATDFSETVLDQNRQMAHGSNPEWKFLDVTKPFDYASGTFDVVYACLTLHYFDHKTTTAIYKEIARVLKPAGLLCFSCKSTKDVDHANGVEVEPGLFVSEKGHARHFFTKQYAQQRVSQDFEVVKLYEIDQQYGSKHSSFIRCIARKKAK